MKKTRWCVLFLGLGLATRLLLPVIVKWQANKTLAHLPDYTGHIGGVHLALWRGACDLNAIEIKHRTGDIGLSIQQFAFNISWPQLLRRAVVADVRVDSPRLRILVSKPVEASKAVSHTSKDVNQAVVQKTGKNLPEALADLIPFQIREFHLQDGTIRLQENQQNLNTLQEKDKTTPKNSDAGSAREKALEARVTHLDIEGHNLTNASKLSGTSYATAQVNAQIMDTGRLKIDMKFDPVAPEPAFNMNVALTQVALAELNPLLRWQWGIDASTGTFAMFSEVATQEGAFKGYVKPFIHHLKMHSTKQDAAKSLGARIKEAVVDVAAAVLKNSKTKNVANRIPFEGRFQNPHVGIWEAVVTILRNAFIKALSPRLDRTINIT